MKDADTKELTEQEARGLRLDNQFAKWVNATASKADIKDLLRAGRISEEQAGEYDPAQSENQPPEIVKGLTRLATWIAAVYKITCSKQLLKKWQKEVPPFPAAISADYRYRWSEVAAWVEQHKVKPLAKGNYADLMAKLEPERIKAELEEIEHARKMREVEAGKYVEKEEALRAFRGIAAALNGIITNWLDLRLRYTFEEKLRQSPLESPLSEKQYAQLLEIFSQLGSDAATMLRTELKDGLRKIE